MAVLAPSDGALETIMDQEEHEGPWRATYDDTIGECMTDKGDDVPVLQSLALG